MISSQKQVTVRSSVLEVLLEITKFCDLYLMERVLDDETEVWHPLVLIHLSLIFMWWKSFFQLIVASRESLLCPFISLPACLLWCHTILPRIGFDKHLLCTISGVYLLKNLLSITWILSKYISLIECKAVFWFWSVLYPPRSIYLATCYVLLARLKFDTLSNSLRKHFSLLISVLKQSLFFVHSSMISFCWWHGQIIRVLLINTILFNFRKRKLW